MKELYVNIEDIYIIGSANDLSEMVTAIDKSLQIIAEYSEQMTLKLSSYSGSIKGKQFQNTVQIALNLREKIYNAACELNGMQNQIVEYQNKVNRFEDMPGDIALPNHFEVTQMDVIPDADEIRMTKSEFVQLASMLDEYQSVVYQQLQLINEKKDEIGSIWRDSQYRDFAQFIEELSTELINELKVFDEFMSYLKERILELE